MSFLSLPSPAKLNLFLHILGRRPDGYHNIQTVFQLIDYCDHLTFSLRRDNKIHMVTEMLNIPSANNLVVQAARKLQTHTQCKLGCDITIDKKIPIGAGLGGGSSNAATTLLALNRLWKLQLSLHELAEIGVQLGADVPVFVHGHSAWAEGIGEKLTPIILPQRWYVLLIPNVQINTTTLYQNPKLSRNSPKLDPLRYHPGDGHNDFQPLVMQYHPHISQALLWLQQHAPTRLTGTGACVFATIDSAEEAGTIASLATGRFNAVVARGLNHSLLHAKLSG